ncbi:peroxiredoxin [Fulvivirga sp. RKSG066]|uniref:peroxiredoxin n=1 Tax=Fulvivirga aurantia TaxID=2529383 RepID=UPI0012BC65DE|nr:peroxiredoxin [Fulvivirga aurantia]MTI22276.1 peroxiredoxin [Fulvivirga aurantia]
MSLVGKKAPVFTAPAVLNGEEIVEDFNLSDYIGKQEVILFFYPKDFTFVCPTEIHAFEQKKAEFEKRGVQVIGVSCDTEDTHLAWLMTPKANGGIEGVTYPLVADASKTIASNYGVLGGDWNYTEEGELTFEGAPISYRGTFYIDKEGIVRHETVNFFPIGRNIDEYIRIVDAWHHFEKNGEVCPANWEEGKEAMQANRDGVSKYLSAN